jgi:pyruvate/2-oxoglutarate dehydrogenase complex dihydrolipoamide acyltransferase (E2) component
VAYEFRLPDIGEGLTEAEIVRWLVEVGDPVELDQPLVEVETAKAIVELPSPAAGVVLHLGADPGDVVEVGEILVVVGASGETWPPEVAPIVGSLPTEAVTPPVRAPSATPESRRPRVLPAARRRARELGVDLDGIEGSGPGGVVTIDDVENAAGSPQPSDTEERVPLSAVRRAIVRNLTRSWSEIPHVTIFDEADATRLMETRARFRSDGVAVSFDALVAAAVIPLLGRIREMHARLDGDEIVFRSAVDLGVAVDTADGLMVVVVRGADRLGPVELSDEIARKSEAVKAGRRTPEDMAGQSFTISNIGAVGGGFGTPIVPPGTTGILSFGRITEKAVVRGGEVVAAPMMPLSLSFDHRLVDGASGRRFMGGLVENLSEPERFLSD